MGAGLDHIPIILFGSGSEVFFCPVNFFLSIKSFKCFRTVQLSEPLKIAIFEVDTETKGHCIIWQR